MGLYHFACFLPSRGLHITPAHLRVRLQPSQRESSPAVLASLHLSGRKSRGNFPAGEETVFGGIFRAIQDPTFAGGGGGGGGGGGEGKVLGNVPGNVGEGRSLFQRGRRGEKVLLSACHACGVRFSNETKTKRRGASILMSIDTSREVEETKRVDT